MRIYKTVFSIPVHERPDVIIDQILNLNHYNPDCAVVLHISKAFNDKNSLLSYNDFLDVINDIKNAYINPNNLDTVYGNIWHTHISNFQYAESISDFEYFVLLSSNELFVREGFYDRIREYACGFNYQNIKEIEKNWSHAKKALSDPVVKEIAESLGYTVNDAVRSQIEGSFFKKGLFERVCKVIQEHYDIFKTPDVIYPREEVYYQEVAYFLVDNKNEILCTYLTHNARDNSTWTVYKNVIDKVAAGTTGEYSVKRIERDINNPSRAYIRELGYGYYDMVSKYVPGISYYKAIDLVFYDLKKRCNDFIPMVKRTVKKFAKR